MANYFPEFLVRETVKEGKFMEFAADHGMTKRDLFMHDDAFFAQLALNKQFHSVFDYCEQIGDPMTVEDLRQLVEDPPNPFNGRRTVLTIAAMYGQLKPVLEWMKKTGAQFTLEDLAGSDWAGARDRWPISMAASKGELGTLAEIARQSGVRIPVEALLGDHFQNTEAPSTNRWPWVLEFAAANGFSRQILDAKNFDWSPAEIQKLREAWIDESVQPRQIGTVQPLPTTPVASTPATRPTNAADIGSLLKGLRQPKQSLTVAAGFTH